MLLTTIKRQQAAQEHRAPGCLGLCLRPLAQQGSPECGQQVSSQRQQEQPAHQRHTRPPTAGTRCARSSRFPAGSLRPGTAESRFPTLLPQRPKAAVARSTGVVAFHMIMRTPSDSSLGEIEPVRLNPRSRALVPRPSSMILGLPVGISPSPATAANSTPTASNRVLRCQPEKASCRRYSQPMHGSTTSSCSHSAIRAARVPVIRMATMMSPVLADSNATCELCRARASSKAAKGRVQTANSAKKLRLTNVEAGCGPCGKNWKSTQNCSAAQSEATSCAGVNAPEPAWAGAPATRY